MRNWDYKVVAAPQRAKRIRGVRGPANAFAKTLEQVIQDETEDGWEFLRADTLMVEMKSGMLSKKRETEQTVLVFRKARERAFVAGRPGPFPAGRAAADADIEVRGADSADRAGVKLGSATD